MCVSEITQETTKCNEQSLDQTTEEMPMKAAKTSKK